MNLSCMKKKKSKTTLILAERFFPEEFLINSLAESWQSQGYKFEVLTQEPSYPYGKIKFFEGYKNYLYKRTYWNEIVVHRVFTIQGYKQSKFLKALNYLNFVILGTICILFSGRKYQTVFIYQTGPLTMALPATLLKKIFNFRVVIWTQDLWPDGVYEYGVKKRWYISSLLDLIVRSVYRNCDHILVSCEGFIAKLKKYTPREITFIPQWSNFNIDRIEFSGDRLLTPDKFHFTFAGNISRHQNLENVISGFTLFASNRDDVCLNIIGDGYHLDVLKKMVAERNIKNIVFYGRKPLNMMPDFLHQSNALVISLLGTPLLELFIPSKFPSYLPFGKPIVCLMNGAVKDFVTNAAIGVHGDPNDANAISKAFEQAFSLSENDRMHIAERSENLLKQKFNKQKLIQRISNFVFTPNTRCNEAIGPQC